MMVNTDFLRNNHHSIYADKDLNFNMFILTFLLN